MRVNRCVCTRNLTNIYDVPSAELETIVNLSRECTTSVGQSCFFYPAFSSNVLLQLDSRASFIPPLAQMQVTFQKRSIAAQVRGRPVVFRVLRIYVM